MIEVDRIRRNHIRATILDVLYEQYVELQEQGLSEDKIRKSLVNIDYGVGMTKLIEAMSADHVDFLEKRCMKEC